MDTSQENPVDSWEDIADSDCTDTSRVTGGSPKTSAVATPPDVKISETDKKRAEEAKVDTKPSETTPPVQKSRADIKTLDSSSGSSLSSTSSNKERSNGRGSKAEGGGGSSKVSLLQAVPKPKDDKENVNIIFIGHVDAGKSTIGGHLM